MNSLLIQSGLHGHGLVSITSPDVVRRYNQCLEAMCSPQTQLTKFSIDGRGWSPEIAEEFGDNYYLSQGDANPYAIIVSPRQKGLPVYFPHHSFDRDLLATVFDQAGTQIAELTGRTGLWLDLDQKFTRYTTPEDLTMISSVVVRVNSIGDLMDAARRQRDLIHKIRVGYNWTDQGLRDCLAEHSRQYGDLRFRSLIIEDIPYMKVTSFHAMSFGGMYVFRENLSRSEPFIVFEQESHCLAGRENVFSLSDVDGLFERLIEEKLLWCPIDLFREKPYILDKIQDRLFTDSIFEYESGDEDFDLTSVTPQGKRQYLQIVHNTNPPEYYELDRLKAKLAQRRDLKPNDLSLGLQRLLLRPRVDRDKDPMLYNLLMRLLSSLVPVPYEVMYAFNKHHFFKQYQTWSTARQKWAVSEIEKNRLKRA